MNGSDELLSDVKHWERIVWHGIPAIANRPWGTPLCAIAMLARARGSFCVIIITYEHARAMIALVRAGKRVHQLCTHAVTHKDDAAKAMPSYALRTVIKRERSAVVACRHVDGRR